MSTLVLLRHGRSTANTSGVLAGWSPGVNLDDEGRKQAQAVAGRLRPVPLAAIVTSPLDRCQQTVAPIWADRESGQQSAQQAPVIDDRIGECRYGDWTGRKISELLKEPLWKVVQQHPSAAVFPGDAGEGLAATQARAVTAVREWNATVEASHGKDAVWLACSHGDVIKAILADAYGMHLDLFQRIVVDPCSVSIIRYSETRPFVVRVNDIGGDLSGLLPPPKSAGNEEEVDSSDAVVGGGAGGTSVEAAPDRPRRVEGMAGQIYAFERPERFVAGTVGEPGDRTFFLQATDESRTVSVALEKTQVALLAERLVELLEEAGRRLGADTGDDPADVDTEPLAAPVEEEFRVGTLSLAWDAESSTVLVEATAQSEDEEAAEDDLDRLSVRLTAKETRAFVARAVRVVAAGRPPCPLCGLPLEAGGHVCPRQNGYRR